jgi:hypothetical protein
LVTAATVVYSYHLGCHPLGASEAYSALAAAQPTASAVALNAMRFDPGKPVLYHLLLHWFCRWFGTSETALRAFSVGFGLVGVVLVCAYGQELFGTRVGFVAGAMWALNPLALVFARWARMYSMFVAFALAHLLFMAKLRRRPNIPRTLLAGVAGAAMLYTHLGGFFIIGADLAVVVREWRYDPRSVSWPAVSVALLLFMPLMPVALAQSHALLFGHWLDWIGVHHSSAVARILAAAASAALLLWLTLVASVACEQSELALRCFLYASVPLIGLAAGSIVIRPMFTVRYAAPSFAVGAVIRALVLDQRGPRLRNDAAFAITALFTMLLPLTYAALDQPWRDIALRVADRASAHETIFFEKGFFSPERVIAQEDNDGFPEGFYLVPFKYYYKKPNANEPIPGDNPLRARQLIGSAAETAGGAWLISGKSKGDAVAELPSGASFQTDFAQEFSRIWVLHVRLLQERASSEQPDAR